MKKAAARQGGARALARKHGRNTQVKASPWQAAEIKCKEECACEAARQVAGQRFLVHDVPSIPMPNCDAPNCKCTYERFTDRRLWGAERRAFCSLKTQLYGRDDDGNRRKKSGRRTEDESGFVSELNLSLKDL